MIGRELDNTGKLTKDKKFNEEKETEESKVDNVEEYRACFTSIKKKDDTVNTSITSIKMEACHSLRISGTKCYISV